jgi:hypothetical protein
MTPFLTITGYFFSLLAFFSFYFGLPVLTSNLSVLISVFIFVYVNRLSFFFVSLSLCLAIISLYVASSPGFSGVFFISLLLFRLIASPPIQPSRLLKIRNRLLLNLPLQLLALIAIFALLVLSAPLLLSLRAAGLTGDQVLFLSEAIGVERLLLDPLRLSVTFIVSLGIPLVVLFPFTFLPIIMLAFLTSRTATYSLLIPLMVQPLTTLFPRIALRYRLIKLSVPSVYFVLLLLFFPGYLLVSFLLSFAHKFLYSNAAEYSTGVSRIFTLLDTSSFARIKADFVFLGDFLSSQFVSGAFHNSFDSSRSFLPGDFVGDALARLSSDYYTHNSYIDALFSFGFLAIVPCLSLLFASLSFSSSAPRPLKISQFFSLTALSSSHYFPKVFIISVALFPFFAFSFLQGMINLYSFLMLAWNFSMIRSVCVSNITSPLAAN